MRLFQVLGLSAWIVGAALAGPAAAQPAKGAPSGAAPSSSVDQARAHFQTGSDLEKAGNIRGAYAEYKTAFGLYPHWQITGNLARAAAKLGKHVEAAEMYQRVRDDPEAQKALSSDARAEVEKGLADAQSKVGTLNVTAPSGAEVWVDGARVGTTPLAGGTLVDPGSHEVELRHGDASLKKARVWSAPGKTATADFSKVVVPTGGAAAPSAEPTGDTGTPRTSKGPRWAGVIALGGAAVVGVAVGAGLWVAGDEKRAEAQKLFDALPTLQGGKCTSADCQAVHDALAAQASMQTGAAIAWGVGGAAAAGAAALWFLTRPASASKAGTELLPVVGVGAGGLIVRGSW